MQKISQKLHRLQDKKKQCQKDMTKWVGDRWKADSDTQERHAQIDKEMKRHLGRKQSWMKKSESCKKQTRGGTVANCSPPDVASVQPWCSSSRWEQHRLGSNLLLFRKNSE